MTESRGLRILYVGTLPPHRGGSAMLAGPVLAGLADRGHLVHALVPRSPDTSAPARTFRTTGFPMPYADIDPSKRSADYRQRQRDQIHARLAALAKSHRADVILVGRESFLSGIPLLSRRHRLPCVLMAQGEFLWKASHQRRSPLLSEMLQLDLVIACAHHLAAALVAAGLRRVRAIPNAVDLARFRPTRRNSARRRALGIAAGATVALHVSNLNDVKRFSDLIDAAALLAEDRPDLRYLVVGDGPTRPIAEDRCRIRGLLDRFRFLGWVDRARLPQYFAFADMVIMPSESEALSLACLEAMACGRLVIASDIPGMREIITDGGTGLLFRMGDIEDLAAKIVLAAHGTDLRNRIGRAARTHVERHHRLEDMVARYEIALTELVRYRRASM